MEVSRKYATIDKYILCRLIGKGGFAKVKYAYDTLSKQYFAIKIIKHSKASPNFEREAREINILRALDHPNIVRLIEFYIDIEYIKKNGSSYKVIAQVLEHIEGPNLAQFLWASRKFQEPIARHFFIEIIEILEYLHDLGISHRDIKLENLMLDHNYHLKIIDFGISDHIRVLSTSGTFYTKTPEIFLGEPENGACTDLFAASVTLFMMISGNNPFYVAIHDDPRYKLLMTNKNDEFWAINEAVADQNTFYGRDFRNLVDAMLSPYPVLRLSLAEVKAHPWFKGDVATHEEIREEFNMRKKMMKAVMQTSMMAKKQNKVTYDSSFESLNGVLTITQVSSYESI